MPGNRSTHLPHVSGGIAAVPSSGSLVVNTGLRNVQAITATLVQDASANVAGVSIELSDPVAGHVQATIKTWEDDGTTAGSSAANVSWIALGK